MIAVLEGRGQYLKLTMIGHAEVTPKSAHVSNNVLTSVMGKTTKQPNLCLQFPHFRNLGNKRTARISTCSQGETKDRYFEIKFMV